MLGDGLSAAFASARLAAETALDFLAGRVTTLKRYEHAVIAELGPLVSFSWNAKVALDRLPRTVMIAVLSPPGWSVIEKIIRGEIPEPSAEKGLHGAAIRGLEALARLTDRPGQFYRIEAESYRPVPVALSAEAKAHESVAKPHDLGTAPLMGLHKG